MVFLWRKLLFLWARYSLPARTPSPGVKTSPCIVNLNDKQMNFKHLLFKTSGLLGQVNRRELIDRSYLENCWHTSVTQIHLEQSSFLPHTSPSSVEFLHPCNINDDTLKALSFLTERIFGITPLLSSHSNFEAGMMDSH